MIDLHCHLLPGIDDGAATMDEAVDLAKHAVQAGIKHSVLTPHLHLARYENFADEISSARDEFQAKLDEQGVKLTLGYAAEVRICPEMMFWIEQKKIPFLGNYEGYDILLLELPHNQVPPGCDNLVRWLIDRNIRPMVAHPERNKEIMANHSRIMPLVNAGCLVQLTAGAVAGKFGSASQETAKYILEQGMATILASDAHNLKHRPPELEHGRQQVEQWLGEAKSWEMVLDKPMEIARAQFEH